MIDDPFSPQARHDAYERLVVGRAYPAPTPAPASAQTKRADVRPGIDFVILRPVMLAIINFVSTLPEETSDDDIVFLTNLQWSQPIAVGKLRALIAEYEKIA